MAAGCIWHASIFHLGHIVVIWVVILKYIYLASSILLLIDYYFFNIYFLAFSIVTLGRFYIPIWFGSFSWEIWKAGCLGPASAGWLALPIETSAGTGALVVAAPPPTPSYCPDRHRGQVSDTIYPSSCSVGFLRWSKRVLVPLSTGQGEMWGREAVDSKKMRGVFIQEMNNFFVSIFSFAECAFEWKTYTEPIHS